MKTEEILFNDYIRPICLPDPSRDIMTMSHQSTSSCFVTGWGHIHLTENIQNSRMERAPVLQQALMKILTPQQESAQKIS